MRSSLCFFSFLLAVFTSSVVARPGLGSLLVFGKTASVASKSASIPNSLDFTEPLYVPAARDPRALSVAQIKNCIVSDKKRSESELSLRVSDEFIGRKGRELSQAAERMEALTAQIDSLSPTATYDELAVSRYNEKVESYNSSLRAYTAAAANFEQEQRMHNTKVTIHNDKLSAFKLDCAGKPYYSEDMEVAQKALTSHLQK